MVSRGHTQGARGQRHAQQERQPGETAGDPKGQGRAGRMGTQGANNGTKVHHVSRRETPC